MADDNSTPGRLRDLIRRITDHLPGNLRLTGDPLTGRSASPFPIDRPIPSSGSSINFNDDSSSIFNRGDYSEIGSRSSDSVGEPDSRSESAGSAGSENERREELRGANELVNGEQKLRQAISIVSQECRRRIAAAASRLDDERSPNQKDAIREEIGKWESLLNELHLREQEIDTELREAEERANDSSEVLRELQDPQRRQQEELKKLETELKELFDQLQDPSLSSAEQDEIRQKILEVLEKMDAIRPPQIRPANRQQQGQPHQQPQSLGQQVGGAAHPSRGSHALSGGGAGAGVGRGGGSPAGGEANSARLAKSASQRIGHELEEIQKGLNADKESIEKVYKTYLTSFSSVCRDPNAFEGLRKQALGALESLSERNKDRLGRLNELQSFMFKPGQPLDQKLLVSITNCKQDCAQFADRLESIKEEVKNLTPAEVIREELSQRRPNILQRHFGQAIRVH